MNRQWIIMHSQSKHNVAEGEAFSFLQIRHKLLYIPLYKNKIDSSPFNLSARLPFTNKREFI